MFENDGKVGTLRTKSRRFQTRSSVSFLLRTLDRVLNAISSFKSWHASWSVPVFEQYSYSSGYIESEKAIRDKKWVVFRVLLTTKCCWKWEILLKFSRFALEHHVLNVDAISCDKRRCLTCFATLKFQNHVRWISSIVLFRQCRFLLNFCQSFKSLVMRGSSVSPVSAICRPRFLLFNLLRSTERALQYLLYSPR